MYPHLREVRNSLLQRVGKNDKPADVETTQNEFDKYFPVETNTGDLNLPDFDFSDFTGVGGVGFDNGNNSNNTTTANNNASAPAAAASQPTDTTNTSTASPSSSTNKNDKNNNNHGQQQQQQQQEDLSDVNFGAISFFPLGPGQYFADPERNRNRNSQGGSRNS